MSYLKISRDSDKVLANDGIILSTENMVGDPFAIYSADDASLTFYADIEIPEEGSKYKGKTATNIYVLNPEDEYETQDEVHWADNMSSIKSITFDAGYQYIKHVSTANWFYGATSCTNADLTYFNASNLVSASSMFRNCQRITEIKLGEFVADQLEDISYMFYNNRRLADLDLSGFKAQNLNALAYAFYYCELLEYIDLSGFNISKATSMNSLFSRCTSLKELDVSGFDTSSVTNMSYMFLNDTSLATIYSDDNMFVTDKVQLSNNSMFADCNSLVGGNGTSYAATVGTVGSGGTEYAHIDVPDNPGYFTAKGD